MTSRGRCKATTTYLGHELRCMGVAGHVVLVAGRPTEHLCSIRVGGKTEHIRWQDNPSEWEH